jgi:HEAT repeat protein
VRAAEAIGKLGPKAKEAIPALVTRLESDDSVEVQVAVEDALREIGPDAVPALLRALGHSNGATRLTILDALFIMGPKAEAAVPALVPLLKDEDRETLREAIHVLSRTRAKAALPPLMDLVRHAPDDHVRRWVISSFANFGHRAADAVPLLIEVLREGALNHRGTYYQTAGVLGIIGRPAVPGLVKLLKDRDSPEPVRQECLYALSQMVLCHGPREAAAAAPALVDTLGDPSPNVRLDAILLLGQLREGAKAAVPALTRFLKHDTPAERIRAAESILEIEPNHRLAIAALAQDLKHADAAVRERAAYNLYKAGPRGAAAVPALVRALGDPAPEVRWRVCQALGQMGDLAGPAARGLVALLQDTDSRVRFEAKEALRRIQKGN